MSFFDAMILGIVQGLTEFLPVSSSGHLVILENLLNIRTDTDVLFHVLLHFGTLIAICLVFKNDLFRMLVETIHIFQDLTANFKIYIDNKLTHHGCDDPDFYNTNRYPWISAAESC